MGVRDLLVPVTNVCPGSKEIQRKKGTMGFNEPTPFKKLLAERRGSSFEDTAHTGSVEEPTQFDGVVYDHAESDESTQLQTMAGEYNESTQFQEVGPVSKKGERERHKSIHVLMRSMSNPSQSSVDQSQGH